MSTDVNSALSKVTSQKAAFLVEAWLVHQAIPDVSTLKFIAAMLELEFEIVRYWFYCRSNFDGIKRAFAESAAEGSKSGILLPSLDEYYLLDKFSEDIDWDYERPKQKLHKHQEELTSNSSTTKMTPQSLQQKDDSISISFSDSPKDLSPINSEHSSSKPGRRKLARKLSKDTLSGNSENENDSSNDSDELLLFGNRSGTSTRIARGKLKGSRPLKPPPIQEVSDVAPRKRGRPPGKSKKSKKAKDEELFSPPPYLARMIDQQQKQQEQDLSKMSSSEHLESIETSEKDISPQFLILLPSSKSQMDTVSKIENSIAPQFDPNKNASLPVAQEAVNNNINIQSLDESTSSTPTTIKASLVGDPVTGEEIRKKIIEQQSVSERERRARIRAQSKLVRGRDSTSNSLVSPQLLSKSKKTKAISSGDRDGGKDEELRNKADNTQNYLSNHNNENGDDKKTNQSNGPLGNIQSFFKEFASIKPKRREKQPIQPQPTNSPSSQDFLPYSSQTTESQQPQTPTTITMEPLSPQYPLPPNVATPTLPSQPYFGGSTQQYRRDREDYGDDSMYSSDRTHRQLSRLHGSFQSKEKLYDRAQDKSSTRSVSRGRSRQPRQLNFRPQIYCEAAQVPNILDGIINEPHGSNAHKDETSSPRLYGQRRFSFDGSRSPYSPEPFDPELLTKLAAKEESIVSLASCQSQPTQSEIHHPLPESQRLPKTENTGDYQDIKYEHQHSSAIGDSNGDQYHISSQHNSSLEPATDKNVS
ncbi:hypothetical protein FBU30_003145 [Linnemannia zychae]|nr:hypothetical protein FBU30_003145 [Linnemannia zychae]